MDRPIAYDKLAREDLFVRMRARDIAEARMEQSLPPFPDLASRESMRERVQGILVGELQAMEGAGRTVYDFPDEPWEFTMDMARQVWDESRHVETYLALLDHLGGQVGEHLGAPVAGAVVDDVVLPILESLCPHGLDRIGQEFSAVESGCDHTDVNLCHRAPLCISERIRSSLRNMNRLTPLNLRHLPLGILNRSRSASEK